MSEKGTFTTHWLQFHNIFFSHEIIAASSLLTLREMEDVIQRIQNKALNIELPKSMWKLDIWACTKCGHRFKSEERLALHNDNICPLCKSCFKSSRHLNDTRYHACLREIYECKVCGKILKTKIELQKHEKKHVKRFVF